MSIIVGTSGNNNILYGDSENDLIVGDRLTYTFPGVTDPVVGNNIIYGGSGNDIIVGDILTYTALVNSSDLSSLNLLIPTYWVGNTLLEGGMGNDFIAGIFGSFTLTFSGVAVNFAGFSFPSALAPYTETIVGDSGNDILTGGAYIVSISAINGADVENFPNDHPSNSISGGLGNDRIAGNCAFYTLQALSKSTWDHATVHFEANLLNGGNGNDVIYGNTEVASFIDRDHSHFVDLDLIYGGDTITAGGGDNVIYGDSGKLSIHIDSTSTFSGSITMGGDNITVGNGNNVIFGDIGHFDLHEISMAQLNSMISSSTLGDIITVGSGNNFISGQWGNDFIALGTGHNTLAYSSEINNKNDTITGFNVTNDVLEGDHVGMFSNGGLDSQGNVIVDVADAGSHSTIDLIGVHNFHAVHMIIA